MSIERKRGRRSFSIALPGLPFEVIFYRKDKSRSAHRGWKMKAHVMTTDSQPPHAVGYFGKDMEIEFYSKKLTRQKIAAFALGLLFEVFEHEVREKMTIDGRRAFTRPHRKVAT